MKSLAMVLGTAALPIAVLSLTMLTPSTASATTFSASGPCSLDTTTGTSPVTVVQSCTSGSTSETYQGTANSSQGHLGTSITTTGGPANQAAIESSLASFTTNVFFSPTAGSNATTIDVSLNLNIAGTLTGQFNTAAAWTVFGGGGAGGFSFSMGSVVQPGGDPSNPIPPMHSETGIKLNPGSENLSTFSDTVNGTATTDLFTVGVGVLVPININLRVNGGAALGATGSANFLNSLDFPLTDIFNLPPGFTVNDSDMFIVNNDFLSPTAATPLPAALPLYASGLGALGLLGWRRKKKAAARGA